VRLVVDSNVVVHVLLAGGELGPLNGHELRAPALLPSEVTSALREMAFRGEVPVDAARQALGTVETIPIAYAEPGSLALTSLATAERLGWAKTYAAEYVALAAELDCPLLTVDARLKRGAAQVAPIVEPSDL
jgi:predicted nucleic acid-binding protein